tara:strand:- start:660 stop:1262 length:603 start_codon:yes stop_codon:yes gene_type:complete
MDELIKFRQFLAEQQSNSLIIVDVQPSYINNIDFSVSDMLEFADNYSSILVLYNGPDLGLDSEQEVVDFYLEELDYNDDADGLLSKMKFFDKGYGFFRDYIDTCVIDHEEIINLVKYMIKNNIDDVRDLSSKDFENLSIVDITPSTAEDYPLHIPELADILPSWYDSDMIGGAENECMEEVDILAKALGIKLNKVKKFIY